MKRVLMSLAILVGAVVFPESGNAISLGQRGLGDVLLYPYYTVNKNQDTLVSIVNPDAGFSVVAKVRFLEGFNSRPVFDFNVYLAPGDTWTGVVTQAGDGVGALLKTSDASCTVPDVPAQGIAFGAAEYDGSGILPADSGPGSLSRTREGFFEVIEAARLVPFSPTDVSTRAQYRGEQSPGTLPLPCASFPGSTFQDISDVRGTLYGSAAVINVGDGMLYAYEPDVLIFADGPKLTADNGPYQPSLAGSDETVGATASIAIAGAVVSLRFARQIDAVSAVLAVDTLYSDYIAAPAIGAASDWIVTFPTQRWYTDPAMSGSPDARAPFVDVFHAPGISRLDAEPPALFDRDGRQCTENFCLFSAPFHLDHAVNAIAFVTADDVGESSGVIGSNLVAYLYPYGEAGRASLRFDAPALRGGVDLGPQHQPDVAVSGPPSIGFMAYNLVNANAALGKLANYGAVYRHKAGLRVCYGTNEFNSSCF